MGVHGTTIDSSMKTPWKSHGSAYTTLEAHMGPSREYHGSTPDEHHGLRWGFHGTSMVLYRLPWCCLVFPRRYGACIVVSALPLLPWGFHEKSVLAARYSHGSSMVVYVLPLLPWDSHGASVGLSRGVQDASMLLAWYSNEASKVLPWQSRGVPPKRSSCMPWRFHGISMAFPCGFHRVSIVLPWDFHGASMACPWCFHGGVCSPIVSMVLPQDLYGALMKFISMVP